MPAPPAPPTLPLAAKTVTASDLVRHFGEWQRRAAFAPVYILHHRRPRFVLASVELMQALADRGAQPSADGAGQMLDALPIPALLVDRDGAIIAAGHPARLCFGDRATPQATLLDLFQPDSAARLTEAVARVANQRIVEQVAVRDPGPPALRIDITVAPHPVGALLAGLPAAVGEERDVARALCRALAAAVDAHPSLATCVLGPIGMLLDPDAALSRLTGRSRVELSTMALPELFHDDDRPALLAAMEAGFASAEPTPIAAALVGPSGSLHRALVAIAPVRNGGPPAALAAAILIERS